MEREMYRVALWIPGITDRYVKGKPVKINEFLDTFYYHDEEFGLFVICETKTGRSLGYGDTLKRAKAMALQTINYRGLDACLRVMSGLEHLNP